LHCYPENKRSKYFALFPADPANYAWGGPPCAFLQFPNVFTPNSDGYNDSFVPIYQYNIRSVQLQIFNRWGKQVYATTDIQHGWNGKGCATGVYFWRAHYQGLNDLTYDQKGYLNLVND
jgi:gliding motility-associated-like protein